MEQKQTKVETSLADMFNTILGDWAMMQMDGPSEIKRVGPDGFPKGPGDGIGKERAIANYWAVEHAITALHCPRFALCGGTIRTHIKRSFWQPLPRYGEGLTGLHLEYWGHFQPLVLEKAAEGYKGVG